MYLVAHTFMYERGSPGTYQGCNWYIPTEVQRKDGPDQALKCPMVMTLPDMPSGASWLGHK